MTVLSGGTFISEETVCSVLQYKCKDGHCIDQAFVCDQSRDCPDNSDEVRYIYISRWVTHGWPWIFSSTLSHMIGFGVIHKKL